MCFIKEINVNFSFEIFALSPAICSEAATQASAGDSKYTPCLLQSFPHKRKQLFQFFSVVLSWTSCNVEARRFWYYEY